MSSYLIATTCICIYKALTHLYLHEGFIKLILPSCDKRSERHHHPQDNR